MPSITLGCLGTAFGFGAALTAALCATFLVAAAACTCLTGWRGLITFTAASDELGPPPSSMKPAASASMAATEATARIRKRGLRLTLFLSAFRLGPLTGKRKGAVSRALRSNLMLLLLSRYRP